VEDGRRRLDGLVILSQDVHRVFGGVVPELASRAHVRTIGSVVDRALTEAGIGLAQVDGIAVTAGPGLVGALLVGVMYGKGLAYGLDQPFLGVNHLEGHLFAPTLEDPELEPPFVALLVSGGHTMLLDVAAWGDYRLLGQTLDDAAGEAFDKVASLLGLGYPGGAPLEQLAREGRPERYRFPRPLLAELARGDQPYQFSFSGLKTAVLRAVRASDDLARDRADLARSFQDAAIEVLAAKTAHAVEALGYSQAMIGGGVACNRALVERLRDRLAGTARLSVASPRLNTDNAAMIAAAGAWRLEQGERSGWDLEPRDDLPIPGLRAPHPHRTLA
jgi:N6-L-threonylcarbamoyladenine synthase